MPIVSSSSGISGRGLGLFGNTLSQLGSISDNFNRANSASLGFTSDGNAQWSVLSGSFSISNNTAISSNSSGVATVDIDSSNVDLNLTVGAGGDALYFRVVDSNNWWRVGTYIDQVTTSVPYSYTTYTWYTAYDPVGFAGGSYGCSPAPAHGHGSSTSSGNSTTAPASFCFSPIPSHTHPVSWPGCTYGTGGSGPITLPVAHGHGASCSSSPVTVSGVSSSTTSFYYVILEKCVAGSITAVYSHSATNTPLVSSIQVTANGSSISVKYDQTGNLLFNVVTDSTHSTATKHGIGRRDPLDVSSSGMDNFAVTRIS